MDAISEARLSLVAPALAKKARDLASVLSFPIRVTQGLRSWNEQAKLYAQGRTAPGPIVTRAAPGHGWHEFGLAVDVVPDDPNQPGFQPDWNQTHPQWQCMETAARALGFACGADFRTFPDAPHLQLVGRFPASPDDEVRQLFKDGGMQAIWEEAFK